MDNNKYIGKTVRVFEETWHYDGVIHDVTNDEDGNEVFFVVDDEYGFLNKVRKNQLKEVVIVKTLKDLD